MKNVLIVYGTRYGASANTSDEIATTLRHKGLTVKVVDAKKEKIKDISSFDLVIVGSGIQINRWTGEPEDFLKKFQNQLTTKKVALFVCCGSASQLDSEKSKDLANIKNKYLGEKATKYNLTPLALGFFGGVYNFNKVPWWSKKVMDAERPKIEAAYKQTEPNVFDTRNLDEIHKWAMDLAQIVQS
ncbi:MAG: nitric oxide synthase [Crenarchaeota archaeon]|nr:nitric oxide synthase [Thermoproteota archaeon]